MARSILKTKQPPVVYFAKCSFVGFIGKNDVEDARFAALSELPGIDRIPGLNLMGTRVTDEGTKSLRRWSGLRVLYLNKMAITDVGLPNLTGLRRLNYLGLDETNVTNDGIERLRTANPIRTISHKSKEEMDAMRREADEALKKLSNSATDPAPPQ